MTTAMIKLRQKVERAIVRRVIKDALSAGYLLTVNNGGEDNEIERSSDLEAVSKACQLADEDYLCLYRASDFSSGWVRFVYGNGGFDVICDYTTNLESIVDGANQLASKLEERLS